MSKIQSGPSDWRVESYIVMEGDPAEPVTYYKASNKVTGESFTAQANLNTINAAIKRSILKFEEAEVAIAANNGVTGIAKKDGTLVGTINRHKVVTNSYSITKDDNGLTLIYISANPGTFTIPTGLQYPFTITIHQQSTGSIGLGTAGLSVSGVTTTTNAGDRLIIDGFDENTYISKKI